VIDIGPGIPTHTGVHTNTHALARYAAICQDCDVVPIVEPEVLMDAATISTSGYQVTQWVLKTQFFRPLSSARDARRNRAEAEHGDRRQESAKKAARGSRGKLGLKHPLRDLIALVDIVAAVHQHFGLDDRNDVAVLADRGITREGVRIWYGPRL